MAHRTRTAFIMVCRAYDNASGGRMCISTVLRYAQTGIGPAKSEAVCQRGLDMVILQDFGDIVAVKGFHGITRRVEIQCWRKDILL